MINTLPTKHHRPSQQSKPRSNTTAKTRTYHVSSGAKNKKSGGALTAIAMITAVAVVGLVVLRFSRAAALPGVYTTAQLEAAQKQVGIDTESLQTLSVSGVTPLKFTPTTDSQVFAAFYIDGKLVGASNQKPFVINYDTTAISNGPHKLSVVVFDQNGNVVATKGYTLSVNNTFDPIQSSRRLIIGQ